MRLLVLAILLTTSSACTTSPANPDSEAPQKFARCRQIGDCRKEAKQICRGRSFHEVNTTQDTTRDSMGTATMTNLFFVCE